MIYITSSGSHMTFSDGGDFSLTKPKNQITLINKGDYVIFSFINYNTTPKPTTEPNSLKYKYSDVTTPTSVSGSDLYDTLSTMLESNADQDFVATAGQTTFTVTDFTPTESSLVFVQGSLTRSGFTLSGNDYEFTVAPGAGKLITIIQ